MPTLTVGDARIPYRIRRSSRARRLRLVVGPGLVEVVAPARVAADRIRAFVDSRRHWLRDKTEALRERPFEPMPARFVDGARLLYRGRHLRLHVETAGGERPGLRFASAFHVRLPSGLTGREAERQTRELVVRWLARRALDDARAFVRRHAPRLGAWPAGLRIGSQKTLWGSCSARGVVSLNWRLMAAPRPIFEYVVVHELCHLREHNHSPRFWRLVESLLPDHRERRAWLRRHGVGLG